MLEETLQSRKALLGRDAVVGVGEFNLVDVGGEGAETLLVGHYLSGQRHAHERAAVEARRERDDTRPAGVSPRDLDRVFDGFRTRRDQHGLGRCGDRSDCVEPLGETHIGFVGRHLEADVAERLHLLFDGLQDTRMLVPRIGHRDPGREVDVALSIFAPDLGIQGARRIDRGRVTDPARYGRSAALVEFGGRGHG